MLSAVPVGDVPVCDVDLYDAETNADPYDAYRAIRDFLDKHVARRGDDPDAARGGLPIGE